VLKDNRAGALVASDPRGAGREAGEAAGTATTRRAPNASMPKRRSGTASTSVEAALSESGTRRHSCHLITKGKFWVQSSLRIDVRRPSSCEAVFGQSMVALIIPPPFFRCCPLSVDLRTYLATGRKVLFSAKLLELTDRCAWLATEFRGWR
jgi:hypothetical protein